MGQDDNHEYFLRVGKIIADARHVQAKSENEVADATGISQSTLSRIESGSCNSVNFITIVALGKYLQIPWTELSPPP